MVVLHVAAFERIDEMRHRRIFRCDGNLHSALRHDAIGVTKPQLRRQDRLGAGAMRMQCSCTTGPATADHQHIAGIVRREIGMILYGAVTFQQRRQLDDRLVAFVRAELDRTIGAGTEIRDDTCESVGRVRREKIWE